MRRLDRTHQPLLLLLLPPPPFLLLYQHPLLARLVVHEPILPSQIRLGRWVGGWVDRWVGGWVGGWVHVPTLWASLSGVKKAGLRAFNPPTNPPATRCPSPITRVVKGTEGGSPPPLSPPPPFLLLLRLLPLRLLLEMGYSLLPLLLLLLLLLLQSGRYSHSLYKP